MVRVERTWQVDPLLSIETYNMEQEQPTEHSDVMNTIYNKQPQVTVKHLGYITILIPKSPQYQPVSNLATVYQMRKLAGTDK